MKDITNVDLKKIHGLSEKQTEILTQVQDACKLEGMEKSKIVIIENGKEEMKEVSMGMEPEWEEEENGIKISCFIISDDGNGLVTVEKTIEKSITIEDEKE